MNIKIKLNNNTNIDLNDSHHIFRQLSYINVNKRLKLLFLVIA